MRRIRRIPRRIVLPCCVNTFTEGDKGTLKQLAHAIRISANVMQKRLENDEPFQGFEAYKIYEATYGVVRAYPMPDHDKNGKVFSVERYLSTMSPWQIRHSHCCCAAIPSKKEAVHAQSKVINKQ